MERLEPERAEVERDPVERGEDARVPDERDAVERLVVREPLRVVPELERELRDDDEASDCVSAWRSLSKSLSACLLVRAALRRSAASAVVTSL